MPNQGSMRAAINEALRMAWDESIGYTFGGDGNPDTNGYDCSAFVIRCLYRAGFSVPSHRVGTSTMGATVLIPAGFTELSYDHNTFVPEPGDIFVMNTSGAGHTFFYMEDVLHYTDSGADSTATSTSGPCKIEASSSRGHTASGDSRKNGTGAYWEVWSHSYYQLVSGYTDNEVKVYRCPWNDITGGDIFGLLAILIGTKTI